MRFPYIPVRMRSPIWALGGRQERPRPLVHVSLTGPRNTLIRRAILDTGADDMVFEEKNAVLLGIDRTNAPQGEALGSGGRPFVVRYALVTLRLTDGHEFGTWPARVGFAPPPFSRSLLGFAGCLQFFGTFFDGEREQVELTVNGCYPGT